MLIEPVKKNGRMNWDGSLTSNTFRELPINPWPHFRVSQIFKEKQVWISRDRSRKYRIDIYKSMRTYVCVLILQWKPLIMITLGQTESDDINRIITKMVVFIWLSKVNWIFNCDHIKRMITLISDNTKWLLLFLELLWLH